MPFPVLIDTTDYECNPQFETAKFELYSMIVALAAYEDSHKHEEEGVNICDPNDTDYHNLVSEMLKAMGRISLAIPFNRACFPLPSGDALLVDI